MSYLLSTMEMTQERQKYADIIHDSAVSLLRVINDILDISKIEAGQLQIQQSPFDPRQEIARTVALFTLQAEEKGLRLGFHVHGDVPQSVVGDAARLRQMGATGPVWDS